jgi:Family of unknown function (DUF6158)
MTAEDHPLSSLDDETLLHELGQLFQTRVETLRHGSDDALRNSDRRINELEHEYLLRYPRREVSLERLRPDS